MQIEGRYSNFKVCDLRGVVSPRLDEYVAEELDKAFGTHALVKGLGMVDVWRDGCLSGPTL